jgi:methylmalonyl-CoA/ethylmalonyl-CoA epimerase
LSLLVPGRVDQIGIVVRDIDAALERWSRTAGFGAWRVYTYGPEFCAELSYRGRPAAFSMHLALAGSEPQVELIQPLAGPSIYHEFLEASGEGVHHVGVFVSSLAEAVARAGRDVLQSGRGYGLDGDGGFAYLDTAAELGTIVELIEVPARRREPERWYPAS